MKYTKNPCSYCNETPKPIIERGGIKTVLDEDGYIIIELNFGGGQSTRTYEAVNYCPMCGRKLEDA